MDPILNHSLGQYQLVSKLGQGGMGVVYQAWQPILKRHVAIKLLPAEFAQDQEFVHRFLAEAQAAARLSHPNIVRVFDFGIENEQQFIVMELLQGESLQALMRRHGALSIQLTSQILGQVGSALAYAHGQGLIHRDVKPANIMLVENARAVLCDFGLAKALEGTKIARMSQIVGTPAYMAPEQITGPAALPATDQYALAMTAYEMLAGQLPFQGSLSAILHAQVYQTPPALEKVRPDVPAATCQSVMRGLVKDPKKRFANVAEFAKALEPPDWPTQLAAARAGSFRRLFGLLVDLAVIAVVAGLVGSLGAASGVSSLLGIVMLVFFCLYFVLGWKLSGQTLGQTLLGIRVVSETHQPVTWGQTFMRWLTQTLFMLFGPFLPIYIAVIYVWHKKGKPPHDLAAKTEALIVSRARRMGLPLPSVSRGRRIAALAIAPSTLALAALLLLPFQLLNNASPVRGANTTAAIAAATAIVSTSVPALSLSIPTQVVATRIPTSTPIALIRSAAAEMNLRPEDFKTKLAIISDQGAEFWNHPSIPDGSVREFEEGDLWVRSAIAQYDRIVPDSVSELIATLEKSLREDAPDVVLGGIQSVPLGERGGIESFQVPSSKREGYMLFFVERNIVVLLIEVGDPDQISIQDVLAHARLIAVRIR